MNQVHFSKRPGRQDLDLLFTWRLDVIGDSPFSERFIPELFLDYFYSPEWGLALSFDTTGTTWLIHGGTLKTLASRAMTFSVTPPITLFGARLALPAADWLIGGRMKANSFLEQDWLTGSPGDLEEFSRGVEDFLAARRLEITRPALLTAGLEETEAIRHYSPRHRRRLIRERYGLSVQELRAIRGMQGYLQQACDFSSEWPRIIDYVDTDTYYDQPHLNRSFKKLTGVSPLEFFESVAVIQDNLMSASYNDFSA